MKPTEEQIKAMARRLIFERGIHSAEARLEAIQLLSYQRGKQRGGYL